MNSLVTVNCNHARKLYIRQKRLTKRSAQADCYCDVLTTDGVEESRTLLDNWGTILSVKR